MADNIRRFLAVFFEFLILFAAGSATIVEPSGQGRARWPKGKVVVSISETFFRNTNNFRSGSEPAVALARAMGNWESVADVEFEIRLTDAKSVSAAGVAGDGVSLITLEPVPANLLLFSKQHTNASAVTRLFSNKLGVITEADIVLNPLVQFSTDGSFGSFDLERVLTHELGHLLGLRHSILASSVMYAEVPTNSISGKSLQLSLDDIGQARSLYGSSIRESNCCAVIDGVSSQPGNVVLVDATTGMVVRAVETDRTGGFDLAGLYHGEYELWYSAFARDKFVADQKVGAVTVGEKAARPLRVDGNPRRIGFHLDLIGSNGMLSKQPIDLIPGQINRVWISGTGLSQPGIELGVSSPHVRILSKQSLSADFAGHREVFVVEIEVSQAIHDGSYSVFAQNATGLRKHLFGVLLVE